MAFHGGGSLVGFMRPARALERAASWGLFDGKRAGMIRRELAADGQSPARWVLIRQIDHAHLARRLAEHWGAGEFAPLQPREALLWAIEHHDDGWRAWDLAPEVDAKRGWPRSFTEMEIDDSTAIWSGSIDAAARAGPLQGYLVAGHFCALARRAAAWKRSEAAWPRAERFIERFEGRMRDWLENWQAESPVTKPEPVAALALAQLQFFDALSLWFCCAEASEADNVVAPGGVELRLIPQDARHIRLAPWPLDVERLNLEVPGRIVPAGHYGTREELAAAPSQPIRLTWELRGEG